MQTATSESLKQASLTEMYGPVTSGYFLVAGLHSTVMSIYHFVALEGMELAISLGASTLLIVAAFYYWRLLKSPQPFEMIETSIYLINLLILLTVSIAIKIDFQEGEFAYFIVIGMVYALTSISPRQFIFSVGATTCCFFLLLYQHFPQKMVSFGMVAASAVICATGVAHFLRKTILQAMAQKRSAESAMLAFEKRLVDAEENSEAMRVISRTDIVTGIPNRRALFDLDEQDSKFAWTSGKYWLVLLDLDGFKLVNDTHGHHRGDELLRITAQTLVSEIGENGFAARIGGDEFAIALSDRLTDADILKVFEPIRRKLASTEMPEGYTVNASVSIGCAQRKAKDSLEQLYRRADCALLEAKRSGKNRTLFYNKELKRKSQERLRIERAIHSANLENELQIQFQPQFELSGERLIGAEALARWSNPQFKDLNPEEFFQIAEECGQIGKISTEIVKKVLVHIDERQIGLPISVNLSANDLCSDPLVDEILGILRSNPKASSIIEFEITETAMLSSPQKAQANIARLAANGHEIVLDDFGTGYSNFNFLRLMPISKLKIDRSFISNISDPTTETIVSSLVGMARALNVKCLLEGVECQLGLQLAKRTGVNFVQGFYFGRPMSAEKFERLLLDHAVGIETRRSA